jgi:hypothetical protein
MIAELFQPFVIFVFFCKKIFCKGGNRGNKRAARLAFAFRILVNSFGSLSWILIDCLAQLLRIKPHPTNLI